MMFDMKSARDGNTVSCWSESIWRLFIGEKLFISDSGQTCFNTEQEAWKSFYDSTYWKRVSEYVCYSQKFFDKVGDDYWREDFETRILDHLGAVVKEYKLIESDGTEHKETTE